MAFRRWLPVVFFVLAGQTAQAAEIKDWTILFYVAGDEEEVRLPTLGMLKRLERVPGLRADGNVRVVVQHDDVGDDPNYRYLMQYVPHPSGSPGPDTPPLSETVIQRQLREFNPGASFHYHELDSGNAVTLKDFVRWGVEAYPARHYMLVLAGHCWGQQGLMQDFFVDGKELEKSTLIKNYELRRAMEELYREFHSLEISTGKSLLPGGQFDLLLIDGCVAGQLDVMLEMADVFRYFAGSSLAIPFYGNPYDEVLPPFIHAVDQRAGADEETATRLLEERFLKPLVKNYVRSHARGGSLVKAEGQMDVVEAFAVRNASLKKVAGRLGLLMEALPTEARTDWLQLKMPELEATIDHDANADVLEMGRGFRRYFKRKSGESGTDWSDADQAASALIDSLGYHAVDTTQETTRLADPGAAGVWVHAQIDESVRQRELAACWGLKVFAMLNPKIPAALLPQFFDDKSQPETARAIDCNELAEGKTAPEIPVYDRPVSMDTLLGHSVRWDHGVPAYLREFPGTDGRIGKRVLSFWLPRLGSEPLDINVRLRLPGTEELRAEYWTADRKPIREENWIVPGYFTVDDAESLGSLYVAEGHTNGSHFKQGFGIFLDHELSTGMQYQGGRLPIERVESSPYSMDLETYFASLAREGMLQTDILRDVDFYRAHRINETGWPDFLFGKGRGTKHDPRPASPGKNPGRFHRPR